jgi:dTDP-4-amino-4,6-dideoxygalactose transaminase
MDIQAAIGIHQLARVETAWKKRESIWQRYMSAFSDLPCCLPPPPKEGTRHAYHLFTIQLVPRSAPIKRDTFLDEMTAERIGVGVHYRAISEHPFYRERFGWHLNDTPNAVEIGRNTISLPISPKLTEEDVEDVIHAVRKIFLRTR